MRNTEEKPTFENRKVRPPPSLPETNTLLIGCFLQRRVSMRHPPRSFQEPEPRRWRFSDRFVRRRSSMSAAALNPWGFTGRLFELFLTGLAERVVLSESSLWRFPDYLLHKRERHRRLGKLRRREGAENPRAPGGHSRDTQDRDTLLDGTTCQTVQ